jgi:hypothetical protein
MRKQTKQKSNVIELKKKPFVSLIALALVTIFVSGCCHGNESSRIVVSEDFLDGLLDELPAVEKCCPKTMNVISDWVAQNEPN